MSATGTRAIFLSYAREDTAAARRIADALRADGVEVWFDQSELRGGDAWDAQIRKQIKECALFLPIISASTQARPEGYFRLEWKLADRRTDLIGKSKAFLVPICIDDTRDGEADVPDSFLAVQWTRLPGGETPAAFCERVRGLLTGELGPRPPPAASETQRPRAAAVPGKSRRWLAPSLAALVAVVAVAIWQTWRKPAVDSSPPATARVNAPSKTATEVAQLRARLIPADWKKDDFEPWSAALDRIIAADDQNADALRGAVWAPASGLQAMLAWTKGNKSEALAAARKVRQHRPLKLRWFADGYAIWVLQQTGQRAEAAEYGAKLLAELPATNSHRGFVLTALGRFDEAVPYLERAGVMSDRMFFWSPMFDPVRDDPRFPQLMAKLGCAEEYKIARETLARLQRARAK